MQNSFTGGEFAPNIDARQDIQKYSTGLKTMKNFYVKPQGAATNRPGTYFVAESKDSANKCRVVSFVFSESIAYVLEFGNYYVRFYRDNGQIVKSTADAWVTATSYVVGDYVLENSLIYRCTTAHTSSSTDEPGTGTSWATYWTQSAIYEVVTPYTSDELDDLKFAQSADVLYIVHPDHVPKTLTRTSDTSWTIADLAYKLGPFAPINLTDTTVTPSDVTGSITLTASSDIFESGHVGSLFKLEQDLEAQTISDSFSTSSVISSASTSKIKSTYSSGYTYTITYTMTVSGTFAGATITLYTSRNNSSWTATLTETAAGTYTATSVVSNSYHYEYAYAIITGTTSGTCTVSLNRSYRSLSTTVTATTKVANYSDTVRGMGTWSVTTHGNLTGVLHLEKSTDEGVTWKKMRQYSLATDNISDSDTEEDEMVMLRLKLYSVSSGTCYYDLTIEPYTATGIVEITAVTSGTVATATVKQAIGSTDSTDLWYYGAWSDVRGYPSTVIFYQNRLVFASTSYEPQTLWGSTTGDYVNFGVSFTVEDDDAITTPLVSEKVNAIKSLKGLSQIVGLTAGGYWVIGSGGDSAWTPSNQSANAQGFYGASSLNPVIIGNHILFAGAKGSSVFDMGYSIQSYSYEATYITLYAGHLFENRTITEWAYAQDPNSIVWCVGSDGMLLGLTYLADQQVAGWHRHETDGTFESVCVIPGDGYDQVWFVVNRTIDGETKRYIEYMAPRTTDATYSTNDDGEYVVIYQPEDQYFVDCGLTYTSDTAATTFTGLDHLEGKTVSILADGNVHPAKTVSGGSVTLDHSAKVVHIGLPYTCDLETMNVEFQAKDGTIQSRNKRISKATIRFEQSRGAWAGTTFNKLYEIKMRSNEAYGDPVALFTGDKDMPTISGSGIKGRVCIRSTDPLPITVLAIISEVQLDG